MDFHSTSSRTLAVLLNDDTILRGSIRVILSLKSYERYKDFTFIKIYLVIVKYHLNFHYAIHCI